MNPLPAVESNLAKNRTSKTRSLPLRLSAAATMPVVAPAVLPLKGAPDDPGPDLALLPAPSDSSQFQFAMRPSTNPGEPVRRRLAKAARPCDDSGRNLARPPEQVRPDCAAVLPSPARLSKRRLALFDADILRWCGGAGNRLDRGGRRLSRAVFLAVFETKQVFS